MIEISDEFIVRHDDEFISLEIPIDWIGHSVTCNDCNKFLLSLNDNTYTDWIIKINGKFYQINENNFSSSGQLENCFSRIILCEHEITKLKLSLSLIGDKNDIMNYCLALEKYEMCQYIKETQNEK